jgi:predicted RNase H-like nuclease (RuvC/YqgF family)
MNKVYLIIPLIGLLIFGSFYYSFAKGHEAHLLEIKAKSDNAKKEKARQQIVDREKAIAAAVEASKLRAEERAKKEKIDEEKKNARQTAEDKRLRANSDKTKLTDQVRRLKKDLEEVQDEIKKIEQDKKTLLDEQVFLKAYVSQAQSNVKYYYDLLDKITLAEKARADAAAAAAAAKKG